MAAPWRCLRGWIPKALVANSRYQPFMGLLDRTTWYLCQFNTRRCSENSDLQPIRTTRERSHVRVWVGLMIWDSTHLLSGRYDCGVHGSLAPLRHHLLFHVVSLYHQQVSQRTAAAPDGSLARSASLQFRNVDFAVLYRRSLRGRRI